MSRPLPKIQIKPKIKLYVCTIYPHFASIDMQYNIEKLSEIPGLEIIPIWIKAGLFSHRHPKDKPDPVQILKRQEYLDKVPDGEWLLVLDSDEIILGGLAMIPVVLELANSNFDDGPECEAICLSEILPDLNIVNRPRFIKKKASLVYGGPNQKHDYIEYTELINPTLSPDPFDPPSRMIKRNYIDPSPTNPHMWTMEGVFFWHDKNGPLKIYVDDEGKDMKAFNLISVKRKDSDLAQEIYKKSGKEPITNDLYSDIFDDDTKAMESMMASDKVISAMQREKQMLDDYEKRRPKQ